MAERFVSTTPYAELVRVDPAKVSDTIVSLATNPDAAIFVSDVAGRAVGMIALLIYDHPYSGVRTAFEVVWWVDPEARGGGLRLLDAAEDWAQEKGAKAIQMVAPNREIGGLYENLGYRPVETSYQRSL